MDRVPRWRRYLRFWGPDIDADVDDELRFHLEMRSREYEARGMSGAEARQLAHERFGDVTRVGAALRDHDRRRERQRQRRERMGDLLHDLRYAVRGLRRAPGFTFVAVLTLALGIGANTTIFSVVNAVLLRPPAAVREPGRLVSIYTSDFSGPRYGTSSYADYLDFRKDNTQLAGLAAFTFRPFNFSTGGAASRVGGEAVTGNYFAVLGVTPALGRAFTPDEGRAPGTEPVAVVSYGLWQRAFGGDPGAIGRTIHVNGSAFTIVGVAPPHFTGSTRGVQADLWVPYLMDDVLTPDSDGDLMNRGNRDLFLIGRLAPGATLAMAQARFRVIGRQLHDAYPQFWTDVHKEPRAITLLAEHDARVIPQLRGTVVGFFALLMTVVGIMLLICCANVANLLLARAAGRQREVAVRLALGAARGRLVRQLLTESAVLATLGAIVGVLLAVWATRLLMAFKPPLPITIALDLSIDHRVLLFTALVAGLTGLIFGGMPALKAARVDLVPALKGAALGARGRRRPAMRSILVVSQVALCVVLLAMAGLLLRSLRAAQTVDLGFEPRQIALASFELGNQAYSEARGRAFYEAIVREAAALPGVRAVSLAESTPLGLSYNRRGVRVEGYQAKPGEDLEFGMNVVGPRYFDVMRIPMARGREFMAQDRAGALPVAIVNESFARYFWPGQDAIGKRIGDGNQMRVVVGVARDSKTRSVSEEPAPFYYMPYLQSYEPNMILEMRTAGDPRAILPAVRRDAAALDPDLPVQTGTMEGALGVSLLPQRAAATLLGIFSLLGLALAAIGLYGVVAYAVSQRTRELGIRVALGAESGDIYRIILRHGMSLVAGGLIIGLGLSMLLGRLVRGFLFGVSPVDPITFAGVAVVLAAVSLVASYVPARRATRVDPLVALREE